jgi:hypothetical protein
VATASPQAMEDGPARTSIEAVIPSVRNLMHAVTPDRPMGLSLRRRMESFWMRWDNPSRVWSVALVPPPMLVHQVHSCSNPPLPVVPVISVLEPR